MRQVIIYPDPESAFWIAECPSLPGCVTQGETREDAIRNIQDAIEGVIAVMREAGDPIPSETYNTLLMVVPVG